MKWRANMYVFNLREKVLKIYCGILYWIFTKQFIDRVIHIQTVHPLHVTFMKWIKFMCWKHSLVSQFM